MIHEGDVPSVQCESNLRWSKSMSEVDGPKFIFAIRGIHTSVIARGPDKYPVFGGYHLYTYCTKFSQDGTLRHPCLHFPWRRSFAFYRNSEFSLPEKRADKVDQTGRKFQSR
jgi:hypothetical protein